MAIIYAEPRYSIRNLALSGIGDILGKVAENWIKRGEMKHLMDAEAIATEAMNTYARNQRVAGGAALEPVKPMATGMGSAWDSVASRAGAGGAAEAAFAPLVQSAYDFRDVDAIGMRNAALQALKAQGKLQYAPKMDMQNLMFLANAMESSRLAEFYGKKTARDWAARDTLQSNMQNSDNPWVRLIAPTAIFEDAPGRAAVEGLVGKDHNDVQRDYNIKYDEDSKRDAKTQLDVAETHAKASRYGVDHPHPYPTNPRDTYELELIAKRQELKQKALNGGISPADLTYLYPWDGVKIRDRMGNESIMDPTTWATQMGYRIPGVNGSFVNGQWVWDGAPKTTALGKRQADYEGTGRDIRFLRETAGFGRN